MAYQAMARRYRPSGFDEVVGQEHVAQTLKNAITSDRVAHAYLFCGPHGVGKTSMARIFAKALNCTGGPLTEIPEDCPICRDINDGNDPDVQEIDGASNNSVDQVRTLREQAGYVPARAKHKIYIIDEVHMLSTSAFNALLKTLEEPPAHVKFILATTEPHKLLETVLSRCQRFDFRLVPPVRIKEYLSELCVKEGASADEDALEAIAAFSNGSMRDSLVLLDQLSSYCAEKITREDVEKVRGAAGIENVITLFASIVTHDAKSALEVVDEISQRGISVGDFLDQLIEYGRDLMLCKVSNSLDNISSYGPAREAIMKHAEALPLEHILLALDVFTSARIKVRGRALSNPLVPLEMAAVRLAGLEHLNSADNVIARIEELAKSGVLSGGIEVSADNITAQAVEPVKKKAENPAVESSREIDVEPQSSPPVQSQPEPAEQYPATEEKPQTAPQPAEPAWKDNLNLGYIKEHWGDFLEEVRQKYRPDIAYLHDVRPIEYNSGRLTIELPEGGVFLMENIEESKRHARITEALSNTFNRDIKFFMKIAENSNGSSATPQAKRKSTNEVMSDPVIVKVMEKFGCELLNIE